NNVLALASGLCPRRLAPLGVRPIRLPYFVGSPLAEESAGKQLRQHARGQELDGGDRREYGDEEQWARAYGLPQAELEHGQIAHQDSAYDAEHQAYGAEEMAGAGAVVQEEEHCQQVQDHAESTRNAVLGLAGLAGVVIYHRLADAVRRCHAGYPHGDETVHLAEQPHLLDDLGAVDLEAAAVIAQAHAGDARDQPIGDKRGQAAHQPLVLPVAAPAREQVQIALEQLLDHAGNVGRVVLQVAVQRGDKFAACGIYAGLHGRSLAEVAAQLDDAHVAAVLGRLAAQNLGSTVPASIVHQDEFPGTGIVAQSLVDAGQHGCGVVGFLIHRNDNGET